MVYFRMVAGRGPYAYFSIRKGPKTESVYLAAVSASLAKMQSERHRPGEHIVTSFIELQRLELTLHASRDVHERWEMEIPDIFGNNIHINHGTLQHLAEYHPEMLKDTRRVGEISDAIKHPEIVVRDADDPKVLIFSSKTVYPSDPSKHYLRVVASISKQDKFMITAYQAPNPKQGPVRFRK